MAGLLIRPKPVEPSSETKRQNKSHFQGCFAGAFYGAASALFFTCGAFAAFRSSFAKAARLFFLRVPQEFRALGFSRDPPWALCESFTRTKFLRIETGRRQRAFSFESTSLRCCSFFLNWAMSKGSESGGNPAHFSLAAKAGVARRLANAATANSRAQTFALAFTRSLLLSA